MWRNDELSFSDDKTHRICDSHGDSEEEDDEEKKESAGDERDAGRELSPDPEPPMDDETTQGEGEERGEEEDGEGDIPVSGPAKSKKKLINAFNYCERASLTNIITSRVSGII